MAKNGNEVKEKKVSYFKAMKTELKKVTWPTPKELINNTVAVISFVLIITLIVFVLDTGFNAINKYGISKLQDKVQSSLKTEDNTAESAIEGTDSNSENIEVTTTENTQSDGNVVDNNENVEETE